MARISSSSSGVGRSTSCVLFRTVSFACTRASGTAARNGALRSRLDGMGLFSGTLRARIPYTGWGGVPHRRANRALPARPCVASVSVKGPHGGAYPTVKAGPSIEWARPSPHDVSAAQAMTEQVPVYQQYMNPILAALRGLGGSASIE